MQRVEILSKSCRLPFSVRLRGADHHADQFACARQVLAEIALRQGRILDDRTRALQLSRQVFDRVNSTPGDIDDWVLAVGYALNAGFPNLLKHVEAHDYKSDGGKSEREKREGC